MTTCSMPPSTAMRRTRTSSSAGALRAVYTVLWSVPEMYIDIHVYVVGIAIDVVGTVESVVVVLVATPQYLLYS